MTNLPKFFFFFEAHAQFRAQGGAQIHNPEVKT